MVEAGGVYCQIISSDLVAISFSSSTGLNLLRITASVGWRERKSESKFLEGDSGRNEMGMKVSGTTVAENLFFLLRVNRTLYFHDVEQLNVTITDIWTNKIFHLSLVFELRQCRN